LLGHDYLLSDFPNLRAPKKWYKGASSPRGVLQATCYRREYVNCIARPERGRFFFPVSDVASIYEDVDELASSVLIVENPVLYPREHLIQPFD